MKRIASLLIALAACALVRIWLISHTDAVAKDGVIYMKMAREWSVDPCRVVQDYDYHIGYPVTIAVAHRILRAVGLEEGMAGWELAGQMVSLLTSLIAMVAVWLFARTAFDHRIAWLTVLLFGIARKWAALGADICSDALAVSLQMWALVLSLLVLRQLSKKSNWAILSAAGVGLCAGAGYLVRPEALLIAVLGIAFWLAYQLYRRLSWPLTLTSVAVTVLTILACVLPYMITIGTLTKKKSITDLILVPAKHHEPTVFLATLPAGQYSSIRVFVNRFLDALHPTLGFLLCIWLLTWIAKNVLRIRLPERILIFPKRLSALFMIAVGVAFIFVLTGLHRNVGYISYRHVMFLAAMLSPLAAAGLIILVGCITILAKRLTLPQWFGRLVLPLATVVVMTILLSYTLEPLHGGKAYTRRAGHFVGASAAADDHIISERRRVIHYAWARNPAINASHMSASDLNKRALLEKIKQTSARYLILSDYSLARSTSEFISFLKGPLFTEVGNFPQLEHEVSSAFLAKKSLDTLRVYRIDHLALSDNPQQR